MPCCGTPNYMEHSGSMICFSCLQVVPEEEFQKTDPDSSDPIPCCEEPYIISDSREGQHVCMNCGKISDSLVVDYFCYDDDGTKTHVEGGRVGDSRQIIRGIKSSKWNLRPITTAEKILFKSNHILAKYNLPTTISTVAVEIFESLHHTSGMLRGKDLNIVTGALLYLAFKQMGIYRTAHECARYVETPVKKFGRILKFLDSKADIKSGDSVPEKNAIVNKYASILEIRTDDKKMIMNLLKILEEEPMSLNAKIGIAFYHVRGDLLAEITDLLKIRKQTVLKNYQKVTPLIQTGYHQEK